ncbi:hypothetical protein Dxin01_03162 [Deinococcus xinjiangensis]|uniref:Uncharacterized protein n=1 Tax=Deinococcus xinjiangensis TaxID=457454 RepID=A0ABP9VGK8_9DEIO
MNFETMFGLIAIQPSDHFKTFRRDLIDIFDNLMKFARQTTSTNDNYSLPFSGTLKDIFIDHSSIFLLTLSRWASHELRHGGLPLCIDAIALHDLLQCREQNS